MWYKKTSDTTLSKGNEVHNTNFTLNPESDRTQEVDGWKWFDTDEEAYQFHNLEIPEPNKKPKRR